MFARADQPQLWLIQQASPKARMDLSIHSEFTVVDTQDTNPPLLCNWEAVAQLEQENRLLGRDWVVTATALVAVMTAPLAPLTSLGAGVLALPYMKWTEWRSAKVYRLLKWMRVLLERFESEEIQIYQRIPIEEENPIDLFIRFPKRAHLIVSIRSRGDAKFVYNEVSEEVRVRKKDRTTSRWSPNPLVELADQERWLAKHRFLFGMTSKEAYKTPTAKVLMLCSPTKIDQHRDELYSEVGALKPLTIRRKGSAFVISEEELADFVAAWLARYE